MDERPRWQGLSNPVPLLGCGTAAARSGFNLGDLAPRAQEQSPPVPLHTYQTPSPC